MDVVSATDPHIRKSIVEDPAAIIPIGSVEQHGPHLPVSTDSDIVGEVAAQVGSGPEFLVMPTVMTGVSFEHAPFFNISIRPATLETVLDDLCESVRSNGIKEIFVVNGHYGNRDALIRFARRRTDVHAMSYWRFTKHQFDHAGFVETSLMLAVSNNTRMDQAKRGLIIDGMPASELRRIKRLAAKSFPEATGNGIWGDPRKANSEAGARILEEIVRGMRAECTGRLQGKLPNEILI